jgi:acetyl-CoA carboxylase biotin carboxylase subunit
MFKKVLVANRAAAASRIIRALRTLGIASVAVFSDADRDLPYVSEADSAAHIGPPRPAESYLNQERIISLALGAGCDGVHPGYGFLSENHVFAAAVERAGLRFIGPPPHLIELMGHKSRARTEMARHGMPMAASSGIIGDDPGAALAAARALGFPIMIKPVSGGGGIGMLAAHDEAQFTASFEKSKGLSERSFGSGELFLERLIENPRHIELQIMADHHGNVRHLFERDCSVQRRHQKIIEEARAPNLAASLIADVSQRITASLSAIGYANIGTVEMLYEPNAGFSFLEMNTRLQVEHAVTEEITGIDIVASQIRLAAGELLSDVIAAEVVPRGHAIQARIYAEDPIRFLPSPGPLTVYRPPSMAGVRVEAGYREGNVVTHFYDPMIAKVIAHGDTRADATNCLARALEEFEIAGLKTNIKFIRQVLASRQFVNGAVHTGIVREIQSERLQP